MADLSGGLGLGSVDFFLLFAVSGLVVWELAEEWPPVRNVLEFIPVKFSSWLGASGEAANFIQTLSVLVLLPGLLFLIRGLTAKWLNRTTLWESIRTFGVLILPVVALGHVVKALLRIASRLPYYSLALKDPVGYPTASLIASGKLKVDMKVADMLTPWMSGLGVLVFVGALSAVWTIGLKSPARRSFGHAGRAIQLTIATLYGIGLLLIIILARI